MLEKASLFVALPRSFCNAFFAGNPSQTKCSVPDLNIVSKSTEPDSCVVGFGGVFLGSAGDVLMNQ